MSINPISSNPGVPGTPGPNLINELADELLLRISSLLSPKDLSNLAVVSKKFCEITNDKELWKGFIDAEKISTLDPNLPLSQELKAFLKIKGKGTGRDVHSEIARILGPTAFSKLPTLTLQDSSRDYIDYVSPHNMTAPIMTGVEKKWSRPFVAFRYVNRMHFDNPTEPKVFVAFQRGGAGMERPIHFASNSKDCTFEKDNEELIGKISRLIKREPIVIFTGSNWVEVDKLPNGQSVVELV